MAYPTVEVFALKTTDRKTGVAKLMKKFYLDGFPGKNVALKANYNSADPFPASTHLDTLRAIGLLCISCPKKQAL